MALEWEATGPKWDRPSLMGCEASGPVGRGETRLGGNLRLRGLILLERGYALLGRDFSLLGYGGPHWDETHPDWDTIVSTGI